MRAQYKCLVDCKYAATATATATATSTATSTATTTDSVGAGCSVRHHATRLVGCE